MIEELIETVWWPDRRSCANILRRADGLLLVEIERLEHGARAFEEPDFWGRVGTDVIVVDTLERAREIASERLRCLNGHAALE